jgi:hypothetical protein
MMITVFNSPAITAPKREFHRIQSTFSIRRGTSGFYQLERNGDLPTGAWNKIGPVVAGDGTVVTFTDASGSASGRAFYRARCWVE